MNTNANSRINKRNELARIVDDMKRNIIGITLIKQKESTDVVEIAG